MIEKIIKFWFFHSQIWKFFPKKLKKWQKCSKITKMTKFWFFPAGKMLKKCQNVENDKNDQILIFFWLKKLKKNVENMFEKWQKNFFFSKNEQFSPNKLKKFQKCHKC